MHKITSHIVKFSDANHNQVLFGGTMMQWIDEAGAIFAREYTGEPIMVTLLFEKFEFHKPVKIGSLVDFFADNVIKGKTSITFNVIAKLDNGEEVVTTKCVFVCVDKDLNKKKINWQDPVEPEDESIKLKQQIVKLETQLTTLSNELIVAKEQLSFYEP